MPPELQVETGTVTGSATNFRYKGLTIPRRFTREGQDPFLGVEYEYRTSVIRDPDGRLIFEMKNVEVPKKWSQVATDILAQKYFRKAGVPQKNPDSSLKLNPDGTPMLGPENSIKQVVHRLAGCWRWWGERYGYFATATDAQVFYEENVHMLLHQMAAPNSPQWFNTGLHWAYQMSGPAQGHYFVEPDSAEMTRSTDAYSHPQPHACFIQSVRDDLVNDGGIMDLWVREARLFKYGSGTGTNFSVLRGKGEFLSGGGISSGLMSWLRIGDRAAGAIKSGGTTRRAAKMVCLDIDHPDIEEFINWKVVEERKVAALVAGGFSSAYEGDAYTTVSGQNSNNSVRLTSGFMQAVLDDADWHLRWRTDGRICKTLKARKLWNDTAHAAWVCADPGVQYDTTINEWHTAPKSGRINASNPCSEYMFLDNSACNLASLNLAAFFDPQSMLLDVEALRHATRLWIITLEISVLMAQYPSKEIAQNSFDFRALGLGYANLGAGVLMVAGIPYDSPEARTIAGAITAIMTGESYATSAEMAKHLGPFAKYELNRSDMLRVIRNHRRAAYNASPDEYEKLAVRPLSIDPSYCPVYLLKAARGVWDRALELGEIYGYRNAQTTLLAPTGTISLLMDCATTGVEPDFALVKFKKLSGGGYFKIVNESVPVALKTMGYAPNQVEDIGKYLRGHATFAGAPHINYTSLQGKGFTEAEIQNLEKQLPGVFEIQFAFNVWTLGEETLQRLGFTADQYNNIDFNLLRAMGFTDEQISEANDYVCGTMTIEGAPYLKKEHYAVFDCANRCGKKGERVIQYMGHIRMMAAVQPFLSGAISKTINMPNETTEEEIKEAYTEAWKLSLKSVALYRDGCKLSQPLTAQNKKEEKKEEVAAVVEAAVAATVAPAVVAPAPTLVFSGLRHGDRHQLLSKRSGVTIEAKVGNQQVYMRTGQYDDGKLGEVFIDMYREGAAFRSMLNLFAISVSLGLQYGVPLEKFVEKFTFTRFEPSGFTTHPNVKMCTSVVDFIFRVLAMEYLGRIDLAQVPPQEIEIQRTAKMKELIEMGLEHAREEKVAAEAAAAVELGEQTAFFDVGAPANVAKEVSEPAAVTEVPEEPTVFVPTVGAASAVDQSLGEMMGDAPPCDVCGHTTVRNGSCYKCLNCGNSMGCS